jgi:hypothetical protein
MSYFATETEQFSGTLNVLGGPLLLFSVAHLLFFLTLTFFFFGGGLDIPKKRFWARVKKKMF